MRPEPIHLLARIRDRLPGGYRDLVSVLAGNLSRNALRGLFKLLAAGFLTPQMLGVVRATWSLFRLTAALAELGIDYAAVSLGAAALGRGDRDRVIRFERVTLALKLVTSTVVLVVGNLLAPLVAATVLGDPALEPYVRLVFLTVSGQLFWRWIVNHLTTHQQFGRLALYLTTLPLLMLLAAIVLLLAGRFDQTTCLLIYLLAPGVTAVGWWAALRARLPGRPLWDRAVAGTLVRFGRWIYLTNLASTNRNHLNAILLKNPRFSGSVAAGEVNAGLYAFGADLAAEITVISKTLVSVLLPKAASRTDGASLRRFVRRAYLHVLVALVPLGLLVFAARPILLLLGQLRESFLAYLPSVEVFVILYLGNLLSVASIPMLTALYAMRLPHVETWIEMAGLVLLVAGAIVLIPRYGAEGGAYAVLIQRVVAFVALVGYGTGRLRRYEGTVA